MNGRRLIPIMIAFAATLALAAFVGASLSPNTKAPDFTTPTLKGSTFTLSDCFKSPSKVVILDIWATTCPPCKAEIPYLQELHKKYGSKGLLVVGVALDGNKDRVKSFIKDTNVTYTIALDPGGEKTGRSYKVTTIPATYIIDKKGVIRNFHNGFPMGNKNAQKAAALEIEKDVKELLAE